MKSYSKTRQNRGHRAKKRDAIWKRNKRDPTRCTLLNIISPSILSHGEMSLSVIMHHQDAQIKSGNIHIKSTKHDDMLLNLICTYHAFNYNISMKEYIKSKFCPVEDVNIQFATLCFNTLTLNISLNHSGE
ncbi:unnamed protein product [Caretta caretta]